MRPNRPWVSFTDTEVTKRFPPDEPDRYRRELDAYWAPELKPYLPRLIDADARSLSLTIARHKPILDLSWKASLRLRPSVWRLYEAIHRAGWWHRDACLVNVVIDDDGRPLLIDWENSTRATAKESYDLWGTAVGAPPAWEGVCVHWFNACPECPSWYWGRERHRNHDRHRLPGLEATT